MHNGSRDGHATPPIIDRRGERRLPSGTQDFESLVSDFVYVDKSPLIAHLCNGRGVTLFCRPRRFGKSCALDMVRCYLEAPVTGWIEDHAALFEGLAVQGSGDRTVRVGLASRWVVDEGGRLPIWFANPQGNEARLLIRICRASDQEVLFESGVLSPGTYVERLEPLVPLDARPVEAEAAIYSFDDDYLSLGTLRLQGTIE